MKRLSLQLVTVDLETGERGVFFGWPLVTDAHTDAQCQVEDIWFSDIQDVSDEMTLAELIALLQRQLCGCVETIQ